MDKILTRLFLIICIVGLFIISCEKAPEKPAYQIKESNETSKTCYTIDVDGCEYIYCHWKFPGSSKAVIAITPKLNQKDPIKCNLGNMRYQWEPTSTK